MESFVMPSTAQERRVHAEIDDFLAVDRDMRCERLAASFQHKAWLPSVLPKAATQPWIRNRSSRQGPSKRSLTHLQSDTDEPHRTSAPAADSRRYRGKSAKVQEDLRPLGLEHERLPSLPHPAS